MVPGGSRFFENYQKMSHRRLGQGKGKRRKTRRTIMFCMWTYVCILFVALQKTTNECHSAGQTQDNSISVRWTLDFEMDSERFIVSKGGGPKLINGTMIYICSYGRRQINGSTFIVEKLCRPSKNDKFHSASHTQDTVQHRENTLNSIETNVSTTY